MAIESQQAGRKPNPDAADVVNTVLKMAYKRAKVATTINATSASEFFTQDVEDFATGQQPRSRRYRSQSLPRESTWAASQLAHR